MSQAESVALERLPQLSLLEEASNLPAGSIKLTGLELTNPDMTFEEWTQIGHGLGHFRKWAQFAIGDWLIFGEALYGEEAAQAVEGTAQERYDVAHRVTGLQVATLQNYASICGRIPIARRRVELDFGVHEPVSALEPDEQIYWLNEAVENGWTRDELRQAIRDSKNPPGEPGSSQVVDEPAAGRSIQQRIEDAARLAAAQAQPTSEGGALIPPEPWAQLLEALGEE